MEHAYIVTDLGFGDAGKGTTVDYLVRQADSAVVVRHNGGAQAEHNVVTPDGRHHSFSQFGSGSFVDGVKTHLSRYMMVSPGMMMTEAQHLMELGVTDIWRRLTIDEDAPILMPWHRAGNWLRELSRGRNAHGSCGIGISELQMDRLVSEDLVIKAGELRKPRTLIKRFRDLQEAKADQLRWELKINSADPHTWQAWQVLKDQDLPFVLANQIEEWLATGLRIVPGSHLQTLADKHQTMVFEGAQGVLLDEWYGFHPYTTWSTTTAENALQLLSELDYSGEVTRLGLMRAYTTRHGPGPFVTEDPGLGVGMPELHNSAGRWMGAFRYGHLDLVAHRYALDVNHGVDRLVVTGLDRSDTWKYTDRYITPDAPDLPWYFTLNEVGQAIAINVGKKDDLDRQARLTELLNACSPRYHRSGTVDGTQLLSAIEDAMGVPVGIASYGPTAADKRVPVVY